MVRDETHLTPLGNPVTRWLKEGETANVNPNCYRAELFHAVAEKGYSIDGDFEGEQNPICKTCRFSGVCHEQTGAGFGFRNQRKDVLEEIIGETKIAASPHISLNPLSSLNPDSYDFSNDLGFWDEWTRILKVTKELTASISDIGA